MAAHIHSTAFDQRFIDAVNRDLSKRHMSLMRSYTGRGFELNCEVNGGIVSEPVELDYDGTTSTLVGQVEAAMGRIYDRLSRAYAL